MTVALRRARASDRNALLAVEAAAFAGDRLSPRAFSRHLGSPRAQLLVAEVEGDVVGYALNLLRADSSAARLYSIATHPARRGSGLGRRLLEAAGTAARDAGCDRLRLEVREDNRQARDWYARSGFRSIGRVENYYADGVAAMRLEKALGGEAGLVRNHAA